MQQEVREKPRPYLPLDRVLVSADEVHQLERLLELLEEDLDLPPRPVPFADRARRPLRVVRQERHCPLLAVDLDDGLDAPERLRILHGRVRGRQAHDLVRDDVAGRLPPLDDLVEHVDLLPEDPEHIPCGKVVKEQEFHVRPIRQQDVTAFHVLRELVRHCGIVGLPRLDAHDGRDERANGQPCVHLRGRLLASVRIAGDAGQGELDHRRVDGEDAAIPEARKESPDPFRRNEARGDFAEMTDCLPVHLLGDFGGPRPVSVRERVALPGRRVAHERQPPPVQVGVVAYLRETRGTGEMPENQHDEVACRRELPRVHAVRVRGLFDEPARNSLNNLPQSMVYSWRRLVWVCFHTCRVYRKTGKATLLFRKPIAEHSPRLCASA